MLYAGDFFRRHASALRAAPNPEVSLSVVSHYLSDRIADSAPLFVMGRWFSAVIGILQVCLTWWGLSRWLPRWEALVGTLLAATSPLLVLYSQYVLSDITGALFAAVAMGLLADEGPDDLRRALGIGAFVGLAAASKFHYGLWLLPALIAPWLGSAPGRTRQALATVAVVVIAFVAVLLIFVPWIWANPVLAVKEFAGVVLAKVSASADGWQKVGLNMWDLARGLGWAVLFGYLPGLWVLVRRGGARALVIAATTTAALIVLARSGVVFDRYALVLAPGALLISAVGLVWVIDRLLARHSWGRALALSLLCVVLSADSVFALRRAALVGSYHEAHAWMLTHLPNGARVVIYSEDNLYMPRSSTQLTECADGIWTRDTYARKWATNGVQVHDPTLAMRLAVLNDEFFHAFWCLRELDTPRPVSFTVLRFHRDPRFDTLSVETMQSEFNAGLTDASRGFDGVLVHFPLETSLKPAQVFVSEPGPRLLLYLRPGLGLRGDATR